MRESRSKKNPGKKNKNKNKNKKKKTKKVQPIPAVAPATIVNVPPELRLGRDVNIFRNHTSKSKLVFAVSLSPEEIKKELRNYYATKLVIKRLFYPDIPIPINKYYVNLYIAPGTDYQKQVDAFASASTEKDEEDIYELSTNIYGQVPFLIPAQSIIPPNLRLNIPLLPFRGASATVDLCPEIRILILGAAGIGKSTFSEYYVHLWASPDFSPSQKCGLINYEWVFRIPLRNITEERYPDKNTLPFDVIEKECLAQAFGKEGSFLEGEDKNKLEAVLHAALNAKKVLIILDGFDEFPENSQEYLRTLVKQFLSINSVIVTSRPYNLHAIRNDYRFEEDMRFEITGFTPVEIKRYIDNFFAYLNSPKKEEAQKLFDFLSRNQNIAGACRVPINLELLCSAWEKQPITQEISSVSALYDFVMLSLCRRYLEKQGENVRNQDDLAILEKCFSPLGFLEHLGFKSASDRRAFFKLSLSREYIQTLGSEEKSENIVTHQKAFGFIRPNNASGEYDGSSHYYFSHLTFRDFFAARYITYCLQAVTQSSASKISFFKHEWRDPENQSLSLRAFIGQRRFSAQYEFIWWFVTGLLSNPQSSQDPDPLTLKYFLGILLSEPDQIEISRVLLLIRCLDEANNLGDKLAGGLIFYVCQWIDAALTHDSSSFSFYNAIWERLKLSRSVFLRDEVQDVFYKKLENPNDSTLIFVLNALDAIKQPLPDEMKQRLFRGIFIERYALEPRQAIALKLASFCDQGLLSIQNFVDIYENKDGEASPHALSVAIEVLNVAKCFHNREALLSRVQPQEFLSQVRALFFNKNIHSVIRVASTVIFGTNRALALFILEARKKYKGLVTHKLEEIFADQARSIDYFLNIAIYNKETPVELCLEILELSLEALMVSGRSIINPEFQKILLEKLSSVVEDSKQDLNKRFFAFYLLEKFNSHNLGSLKKRFLPLLEDFLPDLLKNPCFEEEKTHFVRWISILYVNFGGVFQIQEKEFVEKRLLLFKRHFSDITSPSIKRCVALYLSLNDKNISESSLIEKLNIIISNEYSREEYLLLTAFNPPGSQELIFTKAFYNHDCTPFLGKMGLKPSTNIFSLHHVLAKTLSRSILNFCAEESTKSTSTADIQFKCLIEALVLRYMEFGRALYFDEEGLRYFESHKYQLLSLTQPQRQRFIEVFDSVLVKITKLKVPRLSSRVISSLSKFPSPIENAVQGLNKDLEEGVTERNILSKFQHIQLEEKSKMKEQSEMKEQSKTNVIDLSEAQEAIKKLTTLAKTYKGSDKTLDACLKAMECYGLAAAVLRVDLLPENNVGKEWAEVDAKEAEEAEELKELKETKGVKGAPGERESQEAKGAKDRCEALTEKLNENMLITLRDKFIYNGIGVAPNLDTTHLLQRLKQYQERLKLIRNPKKFKEQAIFEYQVKVTEMLKEVFKDLVVFCQDILGFDTREQNMGVAIVTLGSLATQQAFPYSDVEYIMLLSDERAKGNRARYEALAKLIEIMAISFGETPPVYSDELCHNPVYKGYQRFITKGFRIDEAKKPTAVDWRLSLVNTADGFTSLESLKTFRPGNHLAAALLLPDYLSGDRKLFDDYRQQLWNQIKTSREHFEFLRKLIEFNLQEQQHLLTRFESANLEIEDDPSIGEQEIDLKELSLYGINLGVELMWMLYVQGKLKTEPGRSISSVMDCLKGHLSEEDHAIWLSFIREMMEKRKQAILSSASHTPKVKLATLNLSKTYSQLEQIKKAVEKLKDSLLHDYLQSSPRSPLSNAHLISRSGLFPHQTQEERGTQGSFSTTQMQDFMPEQNHQSKKTNEDFLSGGAVSQTASHLSAGRNINVRQIIAGTYIEENSRPAEEKSKMNNRITVEGKVGSVNLRTGCVSNVGPTMFQSAAEHVQKLTKEGMINDIPVGSEGKAQTIESELGNINGLPEQDSSKTTPANFGHK